MVTVHLPSVLPLPISSGLPDTQQASSHQPVFSDIFSRYSSNQSVSTLEQVQDQIQDVQEHMHLPAWSPLAEGVSQFWTDSPFQLLLPQPASIIKNLVNDAANKPEHTLLMGNKQHQITATTVNPEQTFHVAAGEVKPQPAVKPTIEATTTASLTSAISRQQETELSSDQQITRLPESSTTNINKEQPAEINKIYERLMPLQTERQALNSPAQKEPSAPAPLTLFYGEPINKNTADRQNDSAILSLTTGTELEQPLLKSHRSVPVVSPERVDPPQSQPLLQTAIPSAPDILKPQLETKLSSLETQLTTEATKTAQSNDVMSRAALANPAPKLGQRVLQMISRGESNIEIRLDPPELGKLTLSISVDKDSLNLQITTSTSAVRDLLLTHDGRLRQALAEQGMSLGNLAVNVQSGQQESHQETASSSTDTSGMGVLADETEVDQSFIPGALLFKAQGGRLLDQFI